MHGEETSADRLGRAVAMGRSQPLDQGAGRQPVRQGAEKLCDSRPTRTCSREPLLHQQTVETKYVYGQQQEMQNEYREQRIKDCIGNERDVAKDAKNAQEAHILHHER